MQQIIEAFFYKQNKRGSHWLASLTLIKLHLIIYNMDAYAFIYAYYLHKTNRHSKSSSRYKHKMKANVAFCLQSVIQKHFYAFTLT